MSECAAPCAPCAFIRPNTQRKIQPKRNAATSAPATAMVSSLRSIAAPRLARPSPSATAGLKAIRRFSARPSAVPLSATGRLSP